MKRFILSLLIIPFFFAQTTAHVIAIGDLGVNGLKHELNSLDAQASKSANRQANRLSDIIKKSDSLITTRITALNNLNTRLQNDKRLTSDQKTNVSTQIQSTITGLTALKAKIDADTDVTTALADEKQIIAAYKVFAVFEPKMRLLITLNNVQSIVTTVQAIMPQIQNIINALQAKGKDTSKVTPLITDINTQLQAISAAITTDLTTVNGLSPTTANPQTIIQQVRNNLRTVVWADFQKITQDIIQIRPLLRQAIELNHSPTASPSALPTTASSSATQ